MLRVFFPAANWLYWLFLSGKRLHEKCIHIYGSLAVSLQKALDVKSALLNLDACCYYYCTIVGCLLGFPLRSFVALFSFFFCASLSALPPFISGHLPLLSVSSLVSFFPLGRALRSSSNSGSNWCVVLLFPVSLVSAIRSFPSFSLLLPFFYSPSFSATLLTQLSSPFSLLFSRFSCVYVCAFPFMYSFFNVLCVCFICDMFLYFSNAPVTWEFYFYDFSPLALL